MTITNTPNITYLSGMEPRTDEELLSAIGEGQYTAFTELYNRYWRKLFVVASNKLKDSAVAEELTQNIFADIWARRENLQIHNNFQAYLAVALKYKVIELMPENSIDAVILNKKAPTIKNGIIPLNNVLIMKYLFGRDRYTAVAVNND
ncbi:Sigma-70 region 2 [bacterium A37T11]|nr:Sigma-70 region 2 [bacterium A37T11]